MFIWDQGTCCSGWFLWNLRSLGWWSWQQPSTPSFIKSQFMPLCWKPTTVGCLKWLLSHLCCISVFHCFIPAQMLGNDWQELELQYKLLFSWKWGFCQILALGSLGEMGFLEEHQTPRFAAEWDPKSCVRTLCSPSLSWCYHPVVSEWIRISRKMGFVLCCCPWCQHQMEIPWMSQILLSWCAASGHEKFL